MRINEVENLDLADKDIKETLEELSWAAGNSIAAMKEANGFLYQGLRFDPFTKLPRANILTTQDGRTPLATPVKIHDALDKIFKEHGFKATRNNSIFCTGDYGEARKYAEASRQHTDNSMYLVIPSDTASITWSPKVTDLFYLVNTYESNMANRMKEFEEDILPTYKTDDLVGAIKSKNEIMVAGEYYRFNNKIYGPIFAKYFGIKNSTRGDYEYNSWGE